MDSAEELYSELLLELYHHPLNKKRPAVFGIHEVVFNPLCGDHLELFLTFDDQGKLTETAFEGNGCAISESCTSFLTEKLKNKSRAEISAFSPETILTELGLTKLNPTRLRCATLSLRGFKKAAENS